MKYRSPPLVEAVYEVYAGPSKASPGALEAVEAALRDAYSGQREVLKPVGFQLQVGPGLALHGFHREQHPERTRLWAPSRDRMVQFATNMCALNALPPYTHYLDYVGDLQRLVETYLAVAEPQVVTLLGHRYINKVNLPRGGAPDRFFQVYPAVPQGIAVRHPPFSMQVEVEALPGGGNVVLTLTAIGNEGEHSVYVLDLYARSNGPVPPSWESIRAWHDAAHLAVMSAFEMSITDEARSLFGREEG